MKLTLIITIGMMALMHLSCATIRSSEAGQVDSLLTAAGFKMLPADTPEKSEMLNSSRPFKLQYRVRDGNPLYFYADRSITVGVFILAIRRLTTVMQS